MEIKVSNICKSYRKKQVLNNVSFNAQSGMCIGIIGANGSGKSTLLNILSGVSKANSGEFLCDNVNMLKNSKVRNAILGYVPQGTPLIEELTAYDNLRMWYKKADLKAELQSGVLNVLGINDFLKKPVSKLSGGMKKRLSIGCAVAGRPGIILLDEPTAALDLVCKENIYDYLRAFKSAGGIIIIATHEIQEIELCDSLYILKGGCLSPFEFDGNIRRVISSL